MNWNRCSDALAVVLLLAMAVAPAAAVTTDVTGLPQESQVGTDVRAQFTLTELYEEGTQTWTLRANTELTGVAWTIEKRTLGDNVSRESYSGRSFTTRVSASEDVESVVITVAGTTPAVTEYSYEPRQTYLFAGFGRTVGNSTVTISEHSTHYYTGESRSARTAIDEARTAINETGGDEEAEDLLNNAISAYNDGNFDNAADLANQAKQQAQQAQQSNQRTQLLLFGGLGVLALAVVGGVVYYYRSRQDDYDKLG